MDAADTFFVALVALLLLVIVGAILAVLLL